jgi:glycosyltransferase involved in cell wall biosynthesis
MLSVVVATFRRYDILEECLNSLRDQTVRPNQLEIIVVDNSPGKRESLAFAQRFAAVENIRWIYQERPGLSIARNRGIREARFPLIAFIDDDALAVPVWAEELVDTFDSYGERVTAVGGRIDLGWRTPRPDWLHSSLCKFLTTIDHGSERRLLDPGEEIAGANMAFRKSTFDKFGLFSESLGRKGRATLLSNEDTQLLAAIRNAGDRVAYAPAARVEHVIDPGRLAQPWFRRRIAWQAVSDILDDPEATFAKLDQHWKWLGQYFLRVKPSDRNLRGLLAERGTAEDFAGQINAIYDAVACLLGAYPAGSEQ